ncbi:MAG: anti-sigma factor, partial [Actinomycetota bacterium]|nr:anti-sigma factor [Actinomycetota bacterium]
ARPGRRFRLPSLRPAVALAGVAGLLLLGGVVGVAIDQGDPAAPERTVVAQVDENFAEGATATLIVHERDSKLEVANMPVPRRDRVYQVWLKRPGKATEPTSALFVPRADGSGSVAVPGSLEGVDQVLVTSEPKGGSRRPTTSPVIAASPA